jgi:hypothetical protein
MRVAIPHSLGRDEVRRRIRERSGELVDIVPGGLATVETGWRDEDTMDMAIIAMGQSVTGSVAVEETQMVVTFDLPGQLGFLGGMIEQKIREKGQKLLA